MIRDTSIGQCIPPFERLLPEARESVRFFRLLTMTVLTMMSISCTTHVIIIIVLNSSDRFLSIRIPFCTDVKEVNNTLSVQLFCTLENDG